MQATQNKMPRYMIRNGVLYVHEWEWSSEDASLLGYPARTLVRGARPLSPTERNAPDFHVTFANGWVFALALVWADTPSPGEFVSDLAMAMIYWGDGPNIGDVSSVQTIPIVSPEEFIAVIRDLAERQSLAAPEKQHADDDVEDLIATLNRHSDEIMQGRVFTDDSARVVREMREERDAGIASV